MTWQKVHFVEITLRSQEIRNDLANFLKVDSRQIPGHTVGHCADALLGQRFAGNLALSGKEGRKYVSVMLSGEIEPFRCLF